MTVDRHEAVAGDTPVEAILARHTARRAIYVGPLMIALFWLTRGAEGAFAAAIGVVLVVGNFLLSGALLSISARISLAVYHAAALLGFFLRLGLITMTMLLITQFVDIDRMAFGISTVVVYLALVVWEAVAVAKGRERNLDWIS